MLGDMCNMLPEGMAWSEQLSPCLCALSQSHLLPLTALSRGFAKKQAQAGPGYSVNTSMFLSLLMRHNSLKTAGGSALNL